MKINEKAIVNYKIVDKIFVRFSISGMFDLSGDRKFILLDVRCCTSTAGNKHYTKWGECRASKTGITLYVY